ncbi:hypothetical protein BD289DRAFT_177577 [Coniella lustricola]|uniref:Uncharacterized protein n=1 Tax=Coniella lustricola TaxID=2025994 RepID=A0A2T2ZTI4_9PEZI|nr:hypothetical protein BD289DRAFT_177577 [Coniella lustricola]
MLSFYLVVGFCRLHLPDMLDVLRALYDHHRAEGIGRMHIANSENWLAWLLVGVERRHRIAAAAAAAAAMPLIETNPSLCLARGCVGLFLIDMVHAWPQSICAAEKPGYHQARCGPPSMVWLSLPPGWEEKRVRNSKIWPREQDSEMKVGPSHVESAAKLAVFACVYVWVAFRSLAAGQ